MLKSIVIGIALISLPVMACPELSGNFTCTYVDGQSDYLTVTQSEKEGVSTYLIGEQVIVADGKPQPVTDEDLNGSYVATCTTDALTAVLTGKLLENGSPIGDVVLNSTIAKTAAGLRIEQAGQITAGGEIYPISDSVVCVKVN